MNQILIGIFNFPLSYFEALTSTSSCFDQGITEMVFKKP